MLTKFQTLVLLVQFPSILCGSNNEWKFSAKKVNYESRVGEILKI